MHLARLKHKPITLRKIILTVAIWRHIKRPAQKYDNTRLQHPHDKPDIAALARVQPAIMGKHAHHHKTNVGVVSA